MASGDQILDNIREYSAAEIAHAIRCGELSMYQLSKSGRLTPLLKKRIEEQLANPDFDNSPAEDVESVAEIPAEVVEVPEIVADESAAVTAAPALTSAFPQKSPDTFEYPYYSQYERNKLKEKSGVINNYGMFLRIFSFKGRIRRAEYCLSLVFFCLWYSIFVAVPQELFNTDWGWIFALAMLLSIPFSFWFMIAQSAKRCHDRGNPWGYQFIPYYFLVLMFGDGDKGINRYGTNPKGNIVF